MLYSPGDFSIIEDPNYRIMLKTAYDAIKEENAWEIIAKDPGPGGFMYSEIPELEEVNKRISDTYDGHSGSSYGWTMRQMQYIAKYGWDDYISRLKP